MSTLLFGLLEWYDTLANAILRVVTPILSLAAAAGVVYAVVVGIKFIKAEDKSAREEAKQKLISVIVGIVVTFVLIALFIFLGNNMGQIQTWFNFG